MKTRRLISERGQALVEIAFVFLILIPIVFVILDLGRAIYFYSVVYNAAREGARAGVIPDDYGTEWDIQPNIIRDAVLNKAVGVEINKDPGCISNPPYYYRVANGPSDVNHPACDIFIKGPFEPTVGIYSLTVWVRTKFVPITPLIENIVKSLIDLDPSRPGFDIIAAATMAIEK
jgi:hypothetical protein